MDRTMEQLPVTYKGVVKAHQGRVSYVTRQKAEVLPAAEAISKPCRGCKKMMQLGVGQVANYHSKCRTEMRVKLYGKERQHRKVEGLEVQEGVSHSDGSNLGQPQEGQEQSVSVSG